MPCDVFNAGRKTSVHALCSLCCEAGAEQVKWIGQGGSEAASSGPRYERLGRVRELESIGKLLQKLRGIAVYGELSRSVGNVKQFGRNVPFPQRLSHISRNFQGSKLNVPSLLHLGQWTSRHQSYPCISGLCSPVRLEGRKENGLEAASES